MWPRRPRPAVCASAMTTAPSCAARRGESRRDVVGRSDAGREIQRRGERQAAKPAPAARERLGELQSAADQRRRSRRHRDRLSGSISKLMSTAGAECVSAPTDTKSAPVAASFGNPIERDAAGNLDLRAARARAGPLRECSSIDMLSTSTMSAPAASASSTCPQRLRLDLDGQPGPTSTRRGHGRRDSASQPDVVVLDQNRVEETDAVIRGAAGANRVLLQHAQRRRRLARVEHDDAAGGRVDEPACLVAMPDSRWRKLSAVRSPMSSARAAPATCRAIVAGAAAFAVLPAHAAPCTPGSSCRKVSSATSSPARTQSALTTNTPRARCSGGDGGVGRDVAGRDDLPPSARRTMSRYGSGTSRGGRLHIPRRESPAARRLATSKACTRSADRRSASTCGISATAFAVGLDRHFRDRHLAAAAWPPTAASALRTAPRSPTRRSPGRPRVVSGELSVDERFELLRASATAPCGSSPSCHHDHTSSVTNGRNGANSRSSTDRAAVSAALADRRRLRALFAVPTALDELEIVVAEAPEERLGPLQRARVVVALKRRGRLVHECRQAAEHRAIDRPDNRPLRLGRAQRKLRRIEQLDRQPPADLHLVRIERRVGARPAARRPVTDAVRAVLFEQRERRHDVPLRLRHLLAVRIEHPARKRGVRPRQRVVLESASAARCRTATSG